jgi:hypothetical protein
MGRSDRQGHRGVVLALGSAVGPDERRRSRRKFKSGRSEIITMFLSWPCPTLPLVWALARRMARPVRRH